SHVVYYFFFSSRRRHTRFSRDWSSDVCSSDLNALAAWRAGPAVNSSRLVFPSMNSIRDDPCWYINRRSVLSSGRMRPVFSFLLTGGRGPWADSGRVLNGAGAVAGAVLRRRDLRTSSSTM